MRHLYFALIIITIILQSNSLVLAENFHITLQKLNAKSIARYKKYMSGEDIIGDLKIHNHHYSPEFYSKISEHEEKLKKFSSNQICFGKLHNCQSYQSLSPLSIEKLYGIEYSIVSIDRKTIRRKPHERKSRERIG